MLYLPRPRRHNIPGMPQHVTQRGNNRQACFFKGDDRQTYLELLHEAAIRRVCSEGRFKSSLVDSEAYCLACYRYIELNPVRAAMVIAPQDYRWSSFRTNALGATDPLITPHEQWLQLGNNDAIRRKAYRELFDGNVPCTQVEKIRYTNSKGLPLGSDVRADIKNKHLPLNRHLS